MACTALGHGSDKPGAGVDTRFSPNASTQLHFPGYRNREKRDLNKTCEPESFQFSLRRCWWDMEDTGLAQDSRGLEPGPAMGLVSTLGDIQRTTIEQL